MQNPRASYSTLSKVHSQPVNITHRCHKQDPYIIENRVHAAGCIFPRKWYSFIPFKQKELYAQQGIIK